MTGNEIFAPFLAMVMLTFLVWIVMYVRRIGYMVSNRVHPQKLTTPEKGIALLPEQVNLAAYNLRNLFELPVLFYALCLYLYVTGNVDSGFVIAAWVFVGFRAVHSLVHCTVNVVRLRFGLYMLSSIALCYIAFRAAWQYYLA